MHLDHLIFMLNRENVVSVSPHIKLFFTVQLTLIVNPQILQFT